jgi:NAD(P)-dependent dehydrogenase (short-subunit alcohol dehydrogenase family)
LKDLAGRVAVVTGGGSGIGRGICQQLAAEGMHVVVADIERRAAEETAAMLADSGARILVADADVASPDSMEALADRVYRELGAAHLLCNNAGVIVRGPLVDLTPADWRWLLSVNLEGVGNGVRAFVPRMRKQSGGAHIVNTASIAGVAPLDSESIGLYAASKAAVVAFSEVLRRELEPEGIGVSILLPGRTPSRLGHAARNRPDEFGGRISDVPADAEAQIRNAVRDLGLTEPIENGRALVRGVLANRLYIMADAERRSAPEARFRRMVEDFDAADADARGAAK